MLFTSTNAGNVSTATAKIAARKEAVSTDQKKEDTQYVNERTNYPVITRTEDPEKRTELILHAMQVVRASVLQKCKKQREEEAMRE